MSSLMKDEKACILFDSIHPGTTIAIHHTWFLRGFDLIAHLFDLFLDYQLIFV